MLCQNAFFFKFSLGNKETIRKISLTIEATNGILVLEVKWRHHANGLLRYKWACMFFTILEKDDFFFSKDLVDVSTQSKQERIQAEGLNV